MKTRAFTECDWDGFAGAETWPNGDKPLIGEIKVDGKDFLAVFDPKGVYVTDGEDTNLDLQLAFPTWKAAETFANGLADTTREELRQLGFEEIVG